MKRQIKRLLGKLPENHRAFSYFGTKVYFPKGSIIFHIACETGIYEWDNLRILKALAEESSTVFDIGANIGLMAIPLLASAKNLRVQSFEPSPNSLPYLERTARESTFATRWDVSGKAVGSALGTSEFHVSNKGMGAFDGFRDTARVPTVDIVQVATTTLDSEWAAAGKPRVSVIKVDVEGAEKMVLEGAAACISQNRPSILLEWNPSNLNAFGVNPAWLLSFAKETGYVLHGMPMVAPITSTIALKVHMALNESFLLLPN